ncbi:MAG: hypothetical protein M3O50_16655 [Myxococcota bacterium]|nr:hypothetical protein [Myxococcota bacterium]
MGRAARDEDEGASGSDEDLVAAANLVRAIEDVESLVSSWMPMQGWSDVRRVGHLDERVGCPLGVPDLDVHPGASKENLASAAGTAGIATAIDHGAEAIAASPSRR